jgi:hypothetical protein
MPNEPDYFAFEIPRGVDPDAWARALLSAIERQISIGARKPDDRPRIYIASGSSFGPGHPPQVIAEPSAYRAVVDFDVRDFEADELRSDLPPDAVEVRNLDRRPGFVLCFPNGLWRVQRVTAISERVEFTSETTGERRFAPLPPGEMLERAIQDKLYAYEWYRLFEVAGA